MFFGESIFTVIFWAVIIISIFGVIILFIWFIRRSSRTRYDTSPKGTEGFKIAPPINTAGEDLVDDWEAKDLSESLSLVRDYYNTKTNPYTDKDGEGEKLISKDQVRPHLDKILDYIISKLNYFRDNYGKELIEDNYILETVLKFGTSSIELIINYKAIAFALKDIYPDSPDKKSEVDKLFLGAADILNSKELQEIVKDDTKK